MQDIDHGQSWCERDINGAPGTVLAGGWTYFENVVKHQVRFFLANIKWNHDNPSAPAPLEVLELLVKLVEARELFDTLPTGTVLHRVREVADGEQAPSRPTDFGPPPAGRSTQANRMNPPGISALYTSRTRDTCLQEIPIRSGYRRFVASLAVEHEIKLIDLTQIPAPPRLLAGAAPWTRHSLQFLDAFATMSAKPVARDDREHIEYVPTQVVSEFLMHAFRPKGVLGMKFGSTKRQDANVVLFVGPECIVADPPLSGWPSAKAILRLLNSEEA